MNITKSTIIIALLSLGLLSGCEDDSENPMDNSLSSRINGTWNSPNPVDQYLDENGNVLHEEPFGELQGEITFDNNKLTIIEPNGAVIAGAYTTTEASGRNFIVITIDGDTESIEVNFPSNDQIIMTGFERSDTFYRIPVGDGYEYLPAAKARLYSLLTKK